MNKLKLSIISVLMILALLAMATGCGEAENTSSAAADPSGEAVNSEAVSSEAASSVAEENSEAPSEDAKTILGKWDTVWDMSGLFNTMLSMGDETMGEFVHIEKLDFPMHFTFKEDGTYSVVADEDALKASMEEMAEDLQEGLNKYFEHMIEENSMDMTVEELLAASGMGSMDEYIDMVMSGFEDSSESFSSTGKWSIEDGKLYMIDEDEELNENEYFTYELTENELKLLEVSGTDTGEDGMEELFGDLLDELFPMVLTRAE